MRDVDLRLVRTVTFEIGAGRYRFSLRDARLAVAGYAFGACRIGPPGAPRVLRGAFEPELVPRWGYRTFDCLAPSAGQAFSDLDILIAAGLNGRLDVGSVAALRVATARAAEFVAAAARAAANFGDLDCDELSYRPAEGTAGRLMMLAWCQMNLGRADQDLRDTVLDALDNAVREWAAGIAYLALRPDRPWKAIVYQWQPYLRTRLIDTDVMIVGEQTVALTERVLRHKMTATAIEDALLARADYLDEQKWCENLAQDLGLRAVTLKTVHNPFVPLRLALPGISAPLTDPRVVAAAWQAMRLRKADAIGIEAAGYTIVLQPGHRVWVKAGAGSAEATVPSEVIFTNERLAAVERQGGALSELLGLSAEVA